MVRYVGLYRELNENEHAIVENNVLTPTIFRKEIQVKKFIGHERKEIPVSCLMTNIYLTNKRLMFLIIREVEALVLRKKGVPTLSGIEGSWYEIPVSAIKNVEALNKELNKEKELKKLVPSLADKQTVSLVEITYEGRRTSGNLKEYMESMFDAEGLARMFNFKDVVELANKVQIVGEQNIGIVPKLKGIMS
ncbi:hypothetical protein CW693_04710 [Candidatus Bathyarchaeota archaeon]|nr:MAG: hypothetical protein CW693_04710 [Candidatus Bathyarchaeota archaeon]RLI16130.1 MAG: hypothetical protein DRO41_02695 [Candidatus Bathyarchaeota archaeon]